MGILSLFDEDTKEPSVSYDAPPTSRRETITVLPKFPEGDPKSLIQRSIEGLPGNYTFKAALAIPGKRLFHDQVNLSDLVNSGESLVILTATREVRLWNQNETHIRDARLITDEGGGVTQVWLSIEAENLDDAERKGRNFFAPFLSWLSYMADVAVDVSAYEISEDTTEVRRWVFNCLSNSKHVEWTPPSHLDLTSLQPGLRKLLSAYREGMNTTNPFYKFLCFWKVTEGCDAYNKQRQRGLKGKGVMALTQAPEQIPMDVVGSDIHPIDTGFFHPYLGKTFSEVRTSMENVLRDAIAHLIPGKLVLDPDDFDDISRCEKAIAVIKYIAHKKLANVMSLDQTLS